MSNNTLAYLKFNHKWLRIKPFEFIAETFQVVTLNALFEISH